MLGDISGVDAIYIVCGFTDMRKSIDGLCSMTHRLLDKLGEKEDEIGLS